MICLHCCSEFVEKRCDQKYCSRDCSYSALLERRRAGNANLTRNCKSCGVAFRPDANTQKYCSMACRVETRKQRTRDNYWQNVAPTKVGSCEMCGDAFKTRARKRFCVTCKPKARAEYSKRYAEENSEAIAEKSKRHAKRNAEAIAQRKRERRKNDATYSISSRMGCAVRRAVRGKKMGRSWEELVGYTAQELCKHLERQFERGMGWHNADQWHVDHIVPQASFNYSSPEDEEFSACWALSNLRPLWAEKNVRKHAKRLYLV